MADVKMIVRADGLAERDEVRVIEFKRPV